MNQRLTLLKSIPDGFFDINFRQIKSVFPQPTVIELEGEKKAPLFISILLHGNEFTGLLVMQSLLKKYTQKLPRSIYLMIGNVDAAEADSRCLEHQTDFNRAWPGTSLDSNPTTLMMQEVIDHVTKKPLFAAIDIHNNTGANPHYGCITDIRKENQYICSIFNHIGFVFHFPKGVSTGAFEGVCPAATLESGKPGEPHAVQHTIELVDSLLHLDHFPDKDVAEHDLQMVESLATITINDDIDFSFKPSDTADLIFDEDFELKNFTEITPTDIFAYTSSSKPLMVKNQNSEDITDQIIKIDDGKIYLKKTLMPAMITKDKVIIKQDCLCYLLQDYVAKVK